VLVGVGRGQHALEPLRYLDQTIPQEPVTAQVRAVGFIDLKGRSISLPDQRNSERRTDGEPK
jgi:hypothetical protein